MRGWKEVELDINGCMDGSRIRFAWVGGSKLELHRWEEILQELHGWEEIE
jgi:hypothetical protein